MRTLPALRPKLVAAFAAFVVRIGEDHSEVAKESLGLLLRWVGVLQQRSVECGMECVCPRVRLAGCCPNCLARPHRSTRRLPGSLLREWMALAVSEWPAPQAGEAPAPLAAFDSIHRVEGTALVLLCSTDVEVRRLGVELLRTARDLHRTLASPPQPSSKRSTMTHAGGAAAPGSRAGTAASAASRRATTAHPAPGGGDPGSAPGTPSSAAPRTTYVADLWDK